MYCENFIVVGISQDDEYAVYNVGQQRIRYLVEFTVSSDAPPIERVISDSEIVIDVECSSKESQQKGSFYSICVDDKLL